MFTLPVFIGGVAGLVFLGIVMVLAMSWRVVVPTNLVHIVQSSKSATSYGAGSEAGNTYYKIPAFIPVFGRTTTVLPINNFDVRLDSYDAYDKDRAPFELDVIGFFRITDTTKAASRASSFEALASQLKAIMQGAARTILAKHDIEVIMVERATFGEAFTKEVDDGLTAWGVETVKSLELMDIRDVEGSKIVHNIMAKKSSHIEMESRKAVAENKRLAEIAEIEAAQAIQLQQQEQMEKVGQRTAAQEQAVSIAQETAEQAVQLQAKITMENTKAVEQVKAVRDAEIARAAAVVKAEQDRQTQVINAEAVQQKLKIEAQGAKDAAVLHAQGIEAEGKAKGEAEKALLMAPVSAQITLADKIGKDEGYQRYLVSVRQVEAAERIGVENAGALKSAEVKIIVTSGDAGSGIKSVGDALGAKGGVQLGALLEGLKNTEAGAALLKKFGV